MIKVIVVTPTGEKLKEEVDYLAIQSDDGSRGFLTNHTPLIAKISKGYLRFTKEDKEIYVGILQGVFDINNNIATVVSQHAEIGTNYEETMNLIEKLQQEKLVESRRKMITFVEAERDLALAIKEIKASEL